MSEKARQKPQLNLPKFADENEQRRLKRQAALCKATKYMPLTKRALIFPPSASGSLGDEAMIQALIDQLHKRGFTVDLLVVNPYEDWGAIRDVHNVMHFQPMYQTKEYLEMLTKYQHFYLIGADVMDGYYDEYLTQILLWQVWVASLCCKKVTIAGFSFNTNPSKSCIEIFAALPRKVRICVRDQDSLNRFMKFVGKKATLVADLAFLLKPDEHYPGLASYDRWIRRVRKNNGTVVGMNMSAHSFTVLGSLQRERIIHAYKREITKLLISNPEISILLLPHDTRGQSSDFRLLAEVYKQLPSTYKSKLKLVKMPISAAGIKYLVGQMDVCMVGRMHLTIACMSMSVPVACITYQDKFEGLYRYFGISKSFVLEPDQALKAGAIAKTVQKLISKQNTIQKLINTKLSKVDKLAQKNLA